MGITRFSCPACAAALKLGRALEPDQRIKCPQCAAEITVPAAEAAEREPELASRPLTAGGKAPPAADEAAAAADPKHAGGRPRKRRKRSQKQKANPVLFWGLVGGGAAAVVLGIVVLVLSGKKGSGPGGSANPGGGGPQLAVTNKLLTGEWESAGGGKKYAIEFTGEGKVRLRGAFAPLTDFRFAKPLKVYADFGLRTGSPDITYRCVSDTRLEIRANYLALLEKLSGGGRDGPAAPSPEIVAEYTPTETLTYAVTEKELTLTSDQGKSLRLRRGG